MVRRRSTLSKRIIPFGAGSNISITATAAGASGLDIARVDFTANGQLIGQATSSPFSFTWTNVPAGIFSLRAAAVEEIGGTTTSTNATVITVGTHRPRASWWSERLAIRADRPIGQWNTFHIVLKGDRLTVTLNGKQVIQNAQLPDVPVEGPIALQHHGDRENGEWGASFLQFRNIYIREL